MLVKDLIEKLQQCDPWAGVQVQYSETKSTKHLEEVKSSVDGVVLSTIQEPHWSEYGYGKGIINAKQ